MIRCIYYSHWLTKKVHTLSRSNVRTVESGFCTLDAVMFYGDFN